VISIDGAGAARNLPCRSRDFRIRCIAGVCHGMLVPRLAAASMSEWATLLRRHVRRVPPGSGRQIFLPE